MPGRRPAEAHPPADGARGGTVAARRPGLPSSASPTRRTSITPAPPGGPESVHSALVLPAFRQQDLAADRQGRSGRRMAREPPFDRRLGKKRERQRRRRLHLPLLDHDGEPVVQVLFKSVGRIADPTFANLGLVRPMTLLADPDKSPVSSRARWSAKTGRRTTSTAATTASTAAARSRPRPTSAARWRTSAEPLASPWRPSSLNLVLTGNQGACANSLGAGSFPADQRRRQNLHLGPRLELRQLRHHALPEHRQQPRLGCRQLLRQLFE